MQKYHLIMIPSSTNEDIAAHLSFDKVKEAIDNEETIHLEDGTEFTDLSGIEYKWFETNRERALFIEGYHAGVGWQGGGAYLTKDVGERDIDNYSYNLGRRDLAQLNMAQLKNHLKLMKKHKISQDEIIKEMEQNIGIIARSGDSFLEQDAARKNLLTLIHQLI